jgi:hypothetical protein
MNLTNYYWYFQSAIPHRICDEIVRYGKQLQDQMALTGNLGGKLNKKQIKDLKKKRNSDVVWMNARWIYKEIHPYIHQANASAGWNFLSLVNLQNIIKANTMIGIVMDGTNLIMLLIKLIMGKLENYLLQ